MPLLLLWWKSLGQMSESTGPASDEQGQNNASLGFTSRADAASLGFTSRRRSVPRVHVARRRSVPRVHVASRRNADGRRPPRQKHAIVVSRHDRPPVFDDRALRQQSTNTTLFSCFIFAVRLILQNVGLLFHVHADQIVLLQHQVSQTRKSESFNSFLCTTRRV